MSFYGDQYGVQSYGGIAPGGIRLDNISPDLVAANGGTKLTVDGMFPAGGVALRVFVGLTGTANDAPCFSGVLGDPWDVYSSDGSSIAVVSPPGDKGGQLVTVALGSNLVVLATISLTLTERFWSTKVYLMRKNCPPWYDTGARSLGLEKRL